MSNIAEEIQEISENAEKCVNYPVGDKLAAFMRHQDDDPNFVLSGVLIHAAAKIFGRKVDYLEQEILGIAKNFEQISADEVPKAKEVKKSRTKKFTIKDAINIDKVTFEEKEIAAVTKNDINKTLAVPSKISRLQRMKEFFAKNKSKTGKLPIPKSLLIMNDSIVSNFGGTLIHDYDDYKDIVGSRKDFRSFSHFINHTTGELQSEVNFNTRNVQRDDFIMSEAHPRIIQEPKIIETTEIENLQELSDITALPTPPPSPIFDLSGKVTPIDASINIDEGISLDEDPSSLLLQPSAPDNPFDSFEPFLSSNEETITVETFDKSIDAVRESITEKVVDFELPKELRTEVNETRMKNILMIPLRKLKHKCLFDLPDDEFKELKRRKMDQCKSTVPEIINSRIFKLLPVTETSQSEAPKDDAEPFYGFDKEEHNESLTTFDITSRLSKSLVESTKNDSGFESFERSSTTENATIDESTLNENEDSSHESTILQESSIPEINISGADSCYQSLNSGISGDSLKSLGPSFAEEFNIGNSTEIDLMQESGYVHENNNEEQSSLESEERVKQMQQSAVNVAKWKEFLKPILAESEKRSKIDMHEYGLNVINKIGTVSGSKRFDEIIEPGKTPAYFLTMLQLINNRNIDVKFSNKTIAAPTELHDISLTLKSKVVHKEKFDEMGEQFNAAEESKKLNVLKRKPIQAVQTSTPAKRRSLMPSEMSISDSFNTPNASAIDDENNSQGMCRILSQASSGYFSQNSTFSDF